MGKLCNSSKSEGLNKSGDMGWAESSSDALVNDICTIIIKLCWGDREVGMGRNQQNRVINNCGTMKNAVTYT